MIGVYYPKSTKIPENKKSINLSGHLYLSYGRKALLAMAGNGIGPKTASRILRRAHDDKTLLKLILEAEKNYAKTKRFWKE